MKLFSCEMITALFTLPTLFAAGSVQQTTSQLGQTNNWVIALYWTGDSTTGSVPQTLAQQLAACCQGYLITQVETVPSLPAPTAGYAVAITDAAGVDTLGGAAGSLSASVAQSFAAAANAPPVNGTLKLIITGQSVASAKGAVFIFLSKPGTVNLAKLGGGVGASSANWLTIANPPFADARAYNFTPLSPGGNLTNGVQVTVSLSPFPAGIVAASANTHSLYITDLVSGNEKVLLTAVSVGNTVTFTPGLNHASANWSIGPASGGAQEAWNSLGSGTGTVWLNPGATIQVHAQVTAPCGRSTLDGANILGYALQRASDYPNGNLLELPACAVVNVQNMWIQNSTYPTAQTSGAALHYPTRANATLNNLLVIGGYLGYDFDGPAQIVWNNSNYTADANAAQFAAAWIHDSSGTPNVPVNIQLRGGAFSLTSTARGLVIYTADLAQFSDLAFGGGTIQTYISGFGTNDYLSGLVFADCVWDNALNYPVKIDGVVQMSNLSITGGSISGDARATNLNGVDVCFANSCSSLTDWSITGTKISGMGGSAIAVGSGAAQGTITGGVLHSNNVANGSDGGIKLAAGAADVTITGTDITNTNLGGGHQAWALGTVGAASGVVAVGNNFCGNTSPISLGAVPTNSVINNNACLNSGLVFASLPANMPNGTTIYVTDSNATCTAGASAGRTCFREAGAWTH